jgi:DNA adenine methylase
LNRVSGILPVFLSAIALVILLGTFQPTVAGWILQLSQVFPYPFQGNAPATAGLLGAILGLTLGFLMAPNQVKTVARRTQTRIAAPRPRNTAHQSILTQPTLEGWKPLPPAIKYFGGKSRLAPKIVARIPEHKTCVEPFAGGGSVTLAKPPSQKEVLADKRADLVRFYRYLKTGRKITLPPNTKAVFDKIHHKPESARTPGELVRLQGSSFGSHGQSFASSPSAATGTLLNKRLDKYADRLRNTSIVNQDYATTIKRYDSPSTAYYLDPPYPTDKVGYTDYGRRIPTVEEVKGSVDHAKGKVMISYPNLPSVRDAFSGPGWRIEKFKVLNAMYATTGTAKTRTELLITNYNPRRDRWQPETETG